MNIGEKIRSLRKMKNLTQEQLAEYLMISSQAVSKWETGLSTPDVDMLLKLAVFFHTSVDELLDFEQKKIDDEVEALVRESVPLRENPIEAERFYREALKKYPHNEVILNCLLMMIPNERCEEKIEIGERLLNSTSDDEIKFDVTRLMAQMYHNIGENAMAEHYLSLLPELYFLKTEIAACIKNNTSKMEEIEKTERTCLGILATMLVMRMQLQESDAKKEECKYIGNTILDLYMRFDEYQGNFSELREELSAEKLSEFYM